MIDLSDLANSSISAKDSNGAHAYIFTPCNTTCNIVQTTIGAKTCIGSKGQMKQSGKDEEELIYYNKDGTNPSANVILVCNSTATTPTLKLDSSGDSLEFTLMSKDACPVAVPASPTTPKATTPKATTPKATTKPTKPTTKPTPKPSPTTKPTPKPTTKPTPKPTTKPSPKSSPTTKPTPKPTTKPTPKPTKPTTKPSPKPSPTTKP